MERAKVQCRDFQGLHEIDTLRRRIRVAIIAASTHPSHITKHYHVIKVESLDILTDLPRSFRDCRRGSVPGNAAHWRVLSQTSLWSSYADS